MSWGPRTGPTPNIAITTGYSGSDAARDPDANRLFASPARADGSEKWVDFVAAFWHCECVCGLSDKAFAGKYQKWCRRRLLFP